MKILIASDHAGYNYKTILFKEIEEQGYRVIDLGTYDESPTDYPDQAVTIANALLNNEGDKGIIICGSGVGVSVAANKFRGIRAGVCHDTYSAHQCVEHDNVNILCLGQRVIGIELAREIVFAFLKARFSNAPRHVKRLEKIYAIENKNMKGQ
ncbi:MAG: ribose 5-phosphate isomerase B [Ferruginibacter sp.]